MLTLACAWLAALNARAPLLAIGPLLPLVVADVNLSFTLGGLLTGLPLLLMGFAGLPGGWMVDRFGARRVMVACLLAVAVGGLTRALAPNVTVLLAGTVVLGFAIGILQPALPRVARDTLPHRVPFASAVYFNGFVVGGALGVAATPLLVPVLGGWRGVLLLWAGAGIIGALGWLLVPTRRASGPPPAAPRASDVLDALKLPGMAALTLAMGTQSAIFYTFSSWAPTYLVSRGATLTAATLPVVSLPITTVICSTFAAAMEARLGRRAVIGLSGMLVAAGLVAFLIWPDQAVVPCAIAIGAGTTWAFAVCMAAPAQLAPAHRVGLTAGVLLALGYAESTVGPLALGALRDAFDSYEVGWLLVVVLALVLTATALGIPGRTAQRHTPDQV